MCLYDYDTTNFYSVVGIFAYGYLRFMFWAFKISPQPCVSFRGQGQMAIMHSLVICFMFEGFSTGSAVVHIFFLSVPPSLSLQT